MHQTERPVHRDLPASVKPASETTLICILPRCGSPPANAIVRVALLPSSVSHHRIVFPVLVIRRSKRCCLYDANASATFRPLFGGILFKLNPGPSTNQAKSNVRSHRSPNVDFCLLNACSVKSKPASFVSLCTKLQTDSFAITETWLTPNDAVVCKDK